MDAGAAAPSDAELGRAASYRLVYGWVAGLVLEERQSLGFANAAVEQFAERVVAQASLIKASRESSRRGAETLSARRFQGVLERLQNAVDIGATRLLFAVRKNAGSSGLLVAHNGAPMSLVQLGATAVPWVSTSAENASLTGRFGFGQIQYFTACASGQRNEWASMPSARRSDDGATS